MRKVLLSLLFLICCIPLVSAQPDKSISKEEVLINKLIEINKTLEDIKTSLVKDLDETKKSLESLKKSLSEKTQVRDPEERIGISLKKGNPPEPTQYAKIKIVNDCPLEQTVIVNGETHKVESGKTKLIELVMPGTFTFRVVGSQDTDQTRTINPNQTFTITIYTQK